nr:hypothetical protein [Actinoalloteichus hoggarensis]
MRLQRQARQLAFDQLAVIMPRRWRHVQGVADRAAKTSALVVGNGSEIVSAAFLHDVGYSPGLVVTGFHPLDGARWLRGAGVSQRVVNLVAHHSCARLEARLRGLSAELDEFPDEGPTPVRDALWWADMTTSPDGVPVTFDERISEIQRRYGPEDLVSRFIREAEPELRAAVERTERRLLAAGNHEK